MKHEMISVLSSDAGIVSFITLTDVSYRQPTCGTGRGSICVYQDTSTFCLQMILTLQNCVLTIETNFLLDKLDLMVAFYNLVVHNSIFIDAYLSIFENYLLEWIQIFIWTLLNWTHKHCNFLILPKLAVYG